MAITVTNRTSSYNNVDATSYTTASVTIAAGSVVLVSVWCAIGAGTAPTITVSGLTLSWTASADTAYSGTGVRRVAVWEAFAASGQTGTITITHGDAGSGSTSTGTGWSVDEVTGMDTSDPVLQPTTATGAGSPSSVTLAAASDSNNRPFLWESHRTNSASTSEANWTLLSSSSGNAPNMGGGAHWRSDAFDTTATATHSGGDWGAIALEIKIATAAAPVIPFRTPEGVHAATILLSHLRARPQFSPVIPPPAAPEAPAAPVIPIFVGSTPPLAPTTSPRLGFQPLVPFQEAAPAAASPVIPIFVGTAPPVPPAISPRMGFQPFIPFQEAPAAANPLISFLIASTTPAAPQALVTPTFTRVFFQEAAAAPANPVLAIVRAQLMGQAVPPLVAAPFFFPTVPFFTEAPAANPVIPFITVPVLWWSDPIKRSSAWSPASAPFYFKLIPQNLVAIAYQDYEAILQFDATQYTPAATVLFEVVVKTDIATGYARLFSITDGSPVTGSDLSTASTTLVRLRSGALTLTGAKEYKAQAGTSAGNTTTLRGARLIVQQ